MAESRPITLLHLSDMQFGRNHLFGRLHILLPDQAFDSLAERLQQDIELLQREHALKVDLPVASGDLAEWGLPQEFGEVRHFTGHEGGVWSVAFSPNGQQVVSGSDDGSVRLWDVVTGACLLTLFGTPDGWVAFIPHGQYKFDGDLAGRFWFLIGLCRFEPGELDAYLPADRLQRLPFDAPMLLPAMPRQDTPHG